MDIVDIIKNTKKIYMSEASLQTMMDIERVLDSLDIYAFKNQEASNKTFVDSLKDTEWKSDKCEAKSAHTFTDSTADVNIRKKWSSRVSKNYLKCVDDTDKKNLQVIQLCHSGCTKSKNLYFDKMYIGRMEINMQKATKKKYLYFQIK